MTNLDLSPIYQPKVSGYHSLSSESLEHQEINFANPRRINAFGKHIDLPNPRRINETYCFNDMSWGTPPSPVNSQFNDNTIDDYYHPFCFPEIDIRSDYDSASENRIEFESPPRLPSNDSHATHNILVGKYPSFIIIISSVSKERSLF